MRENRGRIIVAAAAAGALVVALAIGIWLGTRDDDTQQTATTNRTTASTSLARSEVAAADAARVATLFRGTTVKKTRIEILRKWPKPYQVYHDQFSNRCYEWKSGRMLYSLCFKKGLLTLKDPG
ncbi:MAG: hypothetical protein QOJ25_284 [Solirubrobacteraceae bacterium]|nr:hypothetical protein [Solirubrobacteraceae bacterium]